MSLPDRRARVDPAKDDLSVRRQCELLAVARSGVHRPKSETAASDLVVMRSFDELHLALPFHGSRRMQFELARQGHAINRKHAQRLMRTMGIVALVPRPATSKPAPGHKTFPYLLRNVAITQPNHVWATDITYIPMQHGFLYLVAVIPANALHSLGLGQPRGSGVSISMDGRGRFLDNIFIERLWRSMKYEEVHLKAYADGREARAGMGSWIKLYNEARPHQAMDNQTDGRLARRHGQKRSGGKGCGYAASLGQRKRVAHIPTAANATGRGSLIF